MHKHTQAHKQAQKYTKNNRIQYKQPLSHKYTWTQTLKYTRMNKHQHTLP